MDELGNYLDELGSQGERESSGRFTIDVARAREKLRNFRLPSAYHYVLSLVSCAVASQATYLEVRASGGGCLLRFDGPPFAFDDLKGLLDLPVTGGSDPSRVRYHELGIGLLGARRLDLDYLVFGSRRGRVGARLQIANNLLQVEPLRGAFASEFPDQTDFGPVVSEIRIQEKGRLRSAVQRWLGERREVRLLRKHCRFAPSQLMVNGQALNQRRLAPWNMATRLEPSVGELEIPVLNIPIHRLRVEQSPGRWGGYVGYGANPGGILVILHGVAFQPPPDQAFPKARAVIFLDHLSKDLSQAELLKDGTYEEFREQLRGVFSGLHVPA